MAVFCAVQFIVSGSLGLCKYLEMASGEGFKLQDFLQKNELECSSFTLNLTFLSVHYASCRISSRLYLISMNKCCIAAFDGGSWRL